VPRFLSVLTLALLACLRPAFAARPAADVPQLVFPPVDAERLLAEDAARKDGSPLRIADGIDVAITPMTDGSWTGDTEGARTWQLRIRVPAATDLNFGFTRFHLPDGASLRLVGEEDQRVLGPYADDAGMEGELWTPVLAGDAVLLQLEIPAGAPDADLELGRIGAGYRGFGRNPGSVLRPDSGACNIDVACPEGDPWRDEIDSVAVYTSNGELPPNGSGTLLCTGSLVMDVRRTFTPWFLSANHCGVSASNDQTVVTYWNYETAQCGGARNGPLDEAVIGSTFTARRSDADFLLLELSSAPPAAFHPYWAGWDRSDVPPSGTVTIHHPAVDEKAISFNDDPLTFRNSCIGGGLDTHWNVDNYELGTTENGSSGSGLLSVDNRRIVGVLSGGAAWCGNTEFDCYGRFAVGWDGPTPAQRLRDWLDPDGVNPPGVDGSRPDPTITIDSVFISDTCDAGGAGDANGELEPDESAVLVVTLVANNGGFTGVQAELATSTVGVAIPGRTAAWPDLVAESPAVSLAPHLRIRTGMALACGDRLNLTLSVRAAGGARFQIPFSIDMPAPATCVPCLAPCTVEEIASPPLGVLRARKGVGGEVVLSYPQATWCGGAIQVRMSPTARPAIGPGIWPNDPPFADVTSQDTDLGPEFVHDPPDDNRYYLVVETDSGGGPGPSGSY